MTINVKIGKTGEIVEVNEAKFTDAVREYIFNYGLKQVLNDCHSQIKKGDDGFEKAVTDAVAAKLASLYAGEIRVARGEGTSGDPVEDRARALTRKDVLAAARAQGHKAKDIDKDKLEVFVDKYFEPRRDEYMAKARAMMEEERASAAKAKDALAGLFA